jgi:glucose-6-phosphate 1-dehydrogenase
MVSRVIPVDVFDLVIFGGTGDLARRKILPGLYRRFVAGQMVADSRIIGAARADLTDEGFRAQVRAAIAEFVPKARQDAAAIEGFLGRIHYVPIDATGPGAGRR